MKQEEIDFLVHFIVESDAIENIHADPSLVREQIQKQYWGGHVGALLWMESLAQTKQYLDKDTILWIQALITEEQHTKQGGDPISSDWIGVYRQIHCSIRDEPLPDPGVVPNLMKTLISDIVTWQTDEQTQPEKEKVHRIATFHFEYERIHPFGDGNGRSRRALVYYLFRYAGLNPFVFTSHDKRLTYYHCFKEVKAMYDYFDKKYIS